MTNEELMLETLRSIHHMFEELSEDNGKQADELEDIPVAQYFEGKRDAYAIAAWRMKSAIKTLEEIV